MPRSTVDIIIDAEWKGNNAATRAEQSIRDIGDAADKAERQSSGFFQGLIQGAGQQAFGLITDKIGDATRAVIEFGQESIAVAGTVGETTSLLQTSLGPAYEDFVDDVDAVSDADFRVGAMRLDVKKRGTR